MVLGAAIRIPQLFHSLNEMHGFRQTQTALVARSYAEHGINLLHTPLPVFGSGSDVPFEFPLFQAIAAVLARMGLSVDLSMRLLGLVCFQATAVLLFVLTSRWHGRRVATIAVVLLEFSPFGLAWGAASLIEFFAVALALGMVLALDHWFVGDRWWWLAAGALSGWLALLIKVTTATAWIVLMVGSAFAVLVLRGWRSSWRRIVTGGAVVLVPGLVLTAAWTRHADQIKAKNPLTEGYTSAGLRDWNFGTPRQRIEISNYVTILDRVTGEIAGPFLLVLFAGVASAILGMGVADRVRRVAWIVAAAAGPLVFFNLYVVHNYYLCAVFPAITVFAALGIDGVARLVRDRPRAATAIAALATFFVLFCTASDRLGVRDIQQWEHKPPAPAQAAMLKAHTGPDEPIIFIKCDWSPVIPYYSERNAVMFTGAKDPGYWAQATDADKYHWLYSCKPNADPKPYLPPGTQATKADEPGLWHVVRKA